MSATPHLPSSRLTLSTWEDRVVLQCVGYELFDLLDDYFTEVVDFELLLRDSPENHGTYEIFFPAGVTVADISAHLNAVDTKAIHAAEVADDAA